MKDIEKNQGIRNRDNEARYHDNCAHNNRNHKLIGIGAAAGELEEVEDVTQIIVDDVGITKDQPDHIPCVDHGTSKPHHI